jgi:hypothetical protein
MKLNKDKSFSKCCGDIVDGIRYIQDGNGFDGAGKLLGLVKDGRLIKQAREQVTETVEVASVDDKPKSRRQRA